jgi:hypothetical protein
MLLLSVHPDSMHRGSASRPLLSCRVNNRSSFRQWVQSAATFQHLLRKAICISGQFNEIWSGQRARYGNTHLPVRALWTPSKSQTRPFQPSTVLHPAHRGTCLMIWEGSGEHVRRYSRPLESRGRMPPHCIQIRRPVGVFRINLIRFDCRSLLDTKAIVFCCARFNFLEYWRNRYSDSLSISTLTIRPPLSSLQSTRVLICTDQSPSCTCFN